MTERAIEGFLKAEDVMEVVTGPKMQAKFAQGYQECVDFPQDGTLLAGETGMVVWKTQKWNVF